MHVKEYAKVIAEVARVARRYAVFHRTPIHLKPTNYHQKEAYGVPCLEIFFNECELMSLFRAKNLQVVYSTDVFWDHGANFGHRSYLLEKYELFHHPV